MRAPTFSFGLGMALAAAIAVIVLAVGTPAQASTGYWKYTGYRTTPPQSQLDLVKPLPGHVYETRVYGAFQPAYSGAGTLNLYFKTDDADLRMSLTTLEFSFTTGVEMRILTPGQKLHFKGVLQMGGNALAKSIPASGSGKIAADNGDYFLSSEAAIDKPGNGDGDFVVPGGGPGSTLLIYAAGYEAQHGALGGHLEIGYAWVEGTPPSQGPNSRQAAGDPLGSRLDVQEIGQWKGTWTRRPGTNIFDAVWHNNAGGGEVRDVIRLESINGNKVVFTRDGNGGRYYGTLNGRTISGTASWYSPGWSWSGTTGGN